MARKVFFSFDYKNVYKANLLKDLPVSRPRQPRALKAPPSGMKRKSAVISKWKP
jgi:hypothetical protein